MMKTSRKNGGFTLMELLVTIVTASIVTLAATTILLLGMRINRQSIDTASRQTTVRILLSALEDMATEGTITEVKSTPDSWKVIGENGVVLFSFDSEKQKIYTGKADEGTPLMEEVYASYITQEGQLLAVSVETEDGSYTSSVYCRTMPVFEKKDTAGDDLLGNLTDDNNANDDIGTYDNVDGRTAFLKALASQYTITSIDRTTKLRNTGLIVSDGASTGQYYSQWYIKEIGGEWGSNGWNSQTPWCACFISWGLYQAMNGKAPMYHNVDVFMSDLQKNSVGSWKDSAFYNGGYTPLPGDLIFFDWTINNVQNPEHIGAVLKLHDEDEDGKPDYVYTIEGNSAGRVAVRKYMLNDPRIIGYGVLKWK